MRKRKDFLLAGAIQSPEKRRELAIFLLEQAFKIFQEYFSSELRAQLSLLLVKAKGECGDFCFIPAPMEPDGTDPFEMDPVGRVQIKAFSNN